MNPMLQRHCAKFIYIVPDGLRELMSDISREVIRKQPEQVYTFIADYLDALMITRENARIAARLIEDITEIAETTVEILMRIGMSRSEADAVVAIIQIAFKEHLDRKRKFEHQKEQRGEIEEEEEFTQKILNQLHIDEEKLEEMVIIIQTAWRKFKVRQEREKELLFGMVDWRIAARSAIALYKKTGVTKYEANRAATLIKAAYKGYYTRRIMRRLLQKGLESTESTLTEEEEEITEVETEMSEVSRYLRVEAAIISAEESDVIVHDYLAIATPDTQPTGISGAAIAAPPPESWSPATDGQLTDEGQTLPIDVELPGEGGMPRVGGIMPLRGEGGETQGEGQGPEPIEMDESEGKLPPPNTEDVSEPTTTTALVETAVEESPAAETGVAPPPVEESAPPVDEAPPFVDEVAPPAPVEEPKSPQASDQGDQTHVEAQEPISDTENTSTLPSDYTTDDTDVE